MIYVYIRYPIYDVYIVTSYASIQLTRLVAELLKGNLRLTRLVAELLKGVIKFNGWMERHVYLLCHMIRLILCGSYHFTVMRCMLVS